MKQDLSASHAGTVWDGALCLAAYLDHNAGAMRKTFAGKNVLELGAGTGILGLATLAFAPRRLMLTDLKEFLAPLKHNAEANSGGSGTEVSVLPLEWGNAAEFEAALAQLGSVDILLASEVAYDASHIGSLLQTIEWCLQRSPRAQAWVSYQKYKQPEKNLANRLRAQIDSGLRWQEVPEDALDPDYRDEWIGILRLWGGSNGEGSPEERPPGGHTGPSEFMAWRQLSSGEAAWSEARHHGAIDNGER